MVFEKDDFREISKLRSDSSSIGWSVTFVVKGIYTGIWSTKVIKGHLIVTHFKLLLSGRSFENNFFNITFWWTIKRQDIREHVLTRHKDQRIYQCQRCEFLTDDLRETMVDHMIGEHDVRHPLCENVDFQELFIFIENHKILWKNSMDNSIISFLIECFYLLNK